MAVDMFLELDGIKGESVDAVYKDKIDVLAWSWGMSNTGTFHQSTGGGAGRANFKSLVVKKHLDKASMAVMYHAASGKQIAKGSLIVRKAGGKPLDYLVFRFADIMISGIHTESKTVKHIEYIDLEFATVDVEYKMQNERGLGIAAGNFSWQPLSFDRAPLVGRLLSPHKAAFFAEHIDDARVVSKKYGIPLGVVLAQSALESKWGTEVKGGAWFGVKGKSASGKSIVFATHENFGDKRVAIHGRFRAYDNYAESADGYGMFLTTNARYKPCFANKQALKFAEGLEGYGTDPDYVSKVQSIIHVNDLDQYDEL